MFSTLRKYLSNRKLNFANKGRDICLLYHYVGDQKFSKNTHIITCKTFQNQIITLKKKSRFVNEHEFFSKEKSLIPKVLLTFDDNYKTTLSTVAPFLEEEQIPYIFFINSVTANGNMLWRDKVKLILEKKLTNEFINKFQINIIEKDFLRETKNPEKINSKELSMQLDKFLLQQNINRINNVYNTESDLKKFANNITIKFGNHSHQHFCLSTLTNEDLESEIKVTHDFLRNHFDEEKISKLFSVPFGSFASYDKRTIDVLKKYEYSGMLMSAPHYYYNKDSDLTLEKFDFTGYKRLLPKEYYRF